MDIWTLLLERRFRLWHAWADGHVVEEYSQQTEQRGIRRKYIRRFRYAIFYTVEGDELVISAHPGRGAKVAVGSGIDQV